MIYLTPREKAMQEAKKSGEDAFNPSGRYPAIPEKYANQPHLSAAWKSGFDMACMDYNNDWHHSNYQ